MGVPTLIIAHGTALPARDRNEQHPDPVGAELAIHGGDLRHRWTVANRA
jgi:hypothetical protein